MASLEQLFIHLSSHLPLYVFHMLAGLITVCSLLVVVSGNPVKSAIFLVLDLFLIAAVYALLDAHFVAAIQVLVYAGAITVLFVFVIMLLNLKPRSLESFSFSGFEVAGAFAMLIGFFVTAGAIHFGDKIQVAANGIAPTSPSNTKVIALQMFGKYLWPFEMASILILAAIVASIVISKKEEK